MATKPAPKSAKSTKKPVAAAPTPPPNSKMIWDVIDHAYNEAVRHGLFQIRDDIQYNWLNRFEVRLLDGNANHAVFDVSFDYGAFDPRAVSVPDLVIRVEVRVGVPLRTMKVIPF